MLIMKQVIGSAVLFSLRESVTDPACFDPGSGFNTNYQFTGSCFLSVSERRLGKTVGKRRQNENCSSRGVCSQSCF